MLLSLSLDETKAGQAELSEWALRMSRIFHVVESVKWVSIYNLLTYLLTYLFILVIAAAVAVLCVFVRGRDGGRAGRVVRMSKIKRYYKNLINTYLLLIILFD